MPPAQHDPSSADSRWVHELLHFAMQAVRISCSTFYWVDERQQMEFVACEGIPRERLFLYQAKFHAFDPCRPSRLIAQRMHIQTLKYACMSAGDSEIDLYRPYMALSGIKDAMDLLFWHNGRAVAGLGMIAKGNDATFVPETILLARSLRHYVEASLAFHPHVLRDSAKLRLRQHWGLSKREVAVAELIRQGLTNQEIGEELAIALPTVKTHVQGLFRKVGVTNRTSLIAELQLPAAAN